MTDEHNPHFAGCYGHSIVQTPNIDSLARRGVRFQNAYCNSPLCVPSRMSLITGKHAHKVRAWLNSSPLSSDELTIPRFFATQGYLTASAGKMHFVGPDQYHGFERRPFGDVRPERGAGKTRSDAATRGSGEKRKVKPLDEDIYDAGPADNAPSDQFDRRVTEETLRFLREWMSGVYDRPAQDERRPFFFWASWKRPHYPFTPPYAYWNRYDPATVDLPPRPPDPLNPLADCPPRLANWRRFRGLEDLTEAQTRRARAAYYALITAVDDQIGQVLAELADLGLENDTIVVYLADHGEMAGEHGLWFKSVFFDAATKVPLILRFPGRLPTDQVVEHPVQLVDLFPTLASLAGLAEAVPAGLDGADLVPLATGRPDSDLASRDVFCEFYAQGVPSPQRMIRSGRWKYNYYEGELGELYDLQVDPHEFHNLVGAPHHQSLVRELEARLLATWDLAPVRAELDAVLARQRVVDGRFCYTGPNRSLAPA